MRLDRGGGRPCGGTFGEPALRPIELFGRGLRASRRDRAPTFRPAGISLPLPGHIVPVRDPGEAGRSGSHLSRRTDRDRARRRCQDRGPGSERRDPAAARGSAARAERGTAARLRGQLVSRAVERRAVGHRGRELGPRHDRALRREGVREPARGGADRRRLVSLGTLLGVSILGQDGSSPRSLLDKARSAAAEARRANSDRIHFFTDTLKLRSLARLDARARFARRSRAAKYGCATWGATI